MKNVSCHACRIIISSLVVLALSGGCAPVPRGGTPEKAIEKALQPEPAQVSRSVAPAAPPAEIRAALIPAPSVNAAPSLDAAQQPAEERFDIAATDVDAREFFMSLVAGSKANMVVHPAVSGKISVDLKNTTVDEVLQVIHNVYGYPYFKTGTIYQVMPVGLQARTFQVNYLNLVRSGSSQTRVSSGQVSQVKSSDNNDNNSDNNNDQQRSISGSRIDTESVADFWSELKTAIVGLVGSEGGRKVVVQPQASVVVVVAMPEELQLVDDYLKMIQSNLQRQVLIEAKVIEVTLADGYQTGINWAALAKKSNGDGVVFGQGGGGSVFTDGGAPKVVTPDSLTGALSDSLDTSSFGGVFSMALNIGNFQGFVEMLESQGDVQVLSSPRISTINNQKAVIKVGSDEFFVTDLSSDTNSGSTTTTSTDITLTPFFSGIALDVTPQIDTNNQITLHVHPTVSEVTDQTKELNVFGNEQSIPVAYSTVRESDSVIHATSGQLVVIGGLMKENSSVDEAGVPFLSKIPGLGALFKHNRSSSNKQELVILLRPQVISNPADWTNNLESAQQRMQKIAPHFQQDWRRF